MFWKHTDDKDTIEKTAQMADLDAFSHAIQSQVPYIQFTPEGIVTFVNDLFLKIVGFNRDEVMGQHHSALCFPDDVKSRDYETLWRDLRGGAFRNGRFIRQIGRAHV